MPIKNFLPDEKDTPLWKALPEIARLRKGMKTEDPKHPIVDLDYFRVDFNPAFAHLEPIFTELYTARPTVFKDVEMFGDTVDEVYSMDMEQYNTSQTLIRRCDRESQSRWYDEKSGYHMTAKIPCASTWSKEANSMRTAKGCDCDERGKLSIVLRDFADATGIYGYFLVQTGSINDLITIWSALKFWENRCKNYRIPLSMLTFTLGRADDQISAPLTDKQTKQRTGKRINVTKSLFYLYTDREEVVKARELAYSVNALQAPALGLPEGSDHETMTVTIPARRLSNGDLVPADRGNPLVRSILGSGEGERRIGGSRIKVEPPMTLITPEHPTDPATDGRLVKPEPIPVPVPDPEPTPAPAPEPEVIDAVGTAEVPAGLQRAFISARVKYVGTGKSACVHFLGGEMEDPARLYGRDMLRSLGEDFATFADSLKPGPMTQEPTLLPESLVVSAEEVTKDSGYAYWLVKTLARSEQQAPAPVVAGEITEANNELPAIA